MVTDSEHVKDAIGQRLNAVCKDRANAKTVRVVMGRWERIGWKAEPIMKALGKGFGKNSFAVKTLIETADGNLLKAEISAGRMVKLGEGKAIFDIGADHVTFAEQLPPEVFSAPMTDATVYVDVQLTPELEAEGYAREVIRRINEMRKQLDLAVEDFIVADSTVANERICALIQGSWRAGIMEEVRARELSIHNTGAAAKTYEMVKDWDVEGVAMTISISTSVKPLFWPQVFINNFPSR